MDNDARLSVNMTPSLVIPDARGAIRNPGATG
jgi:hypothetical protein